MKACVFILAICLLFEGSAYSQTPIPDSNQAKMIEAPSAVFPDAASNPIFGGSIRAMVDVDPTGKVTAARVFGLFIPCANPKEPAVEAINNAALAAAKAAIFEPTLKDGKPVAARLYLTYRFRPNQTPSSGEERKTVFGGLLNESTISLPQPEIPPLAKANGLNGSLRVQVLVSEDGHVMSAVLSVGHVYFEEVAVAAACSARFGPFTFQGEPAKRSGFIEYKFVPPSSR